MSISEFAQPAASKPIIDTNASATVDPVADVYTVAVRAMCEFTAKAGDLDLRFTPSPTAQDGIAGHKLVASRRGSDYETEITVAGQWRSLRVRGRADGYDPRANRLEEVKTHRGDVARMRANRRALHWAQAKVYGWLLCEKRGLSEINVALVYFNVATQEETVLTELHSADSLKAFFEMQCEAFLTWAVQELAHRKVRDAMLSDLAFPHAEFRPGQRQLAEAVYRTAIGGRRLMAEAPTGIGKTVGTLFPLLKAMPGQRLDKIFFLAAKTPGRRLALDALDFITATPQVAELTPRSLRVIELVARDKSCEHPDKACHAESCPLAHGFYDRLPQARQQAMDEGAMDRGALRDVALKHGICPYFLTQDLVRWADVVVGDYNYYFDVNAMLHAMATGAEWRTAVLLDEAHNLIDRARKMYSAELDFRALELAQRAAPSPIKRTLRRLARVWEEAHRDQSAPYVVYDDIPLKLRRSLQEARADFMDYEGAAGTELAEGPVQEFFFALLHFSKLAEQFGRHSLFDVTLLSASSSRSNMSSSILALRNVVPGPFLASRFAATQSAVLFSATLSPAHYYTGLLGLPDDTVTVEVEAPFRAEQLRVEVARNISTRFPDRNRSLAPIAALMARQYRERPGNYLAFLSSYEYLDRVADELVTRDPAIDIWRQSRSMDESAREGFLARFAEGGRGIGFAVLGGPFAEGIDLPGDRLVGAFIATLGLPQVNAINEQVRTRMQAVFGAGYDYAYLYPGLQKIVQAAGRVIRTPTDEGVIHLMDDRFNRSEVRRLLPSWWRVDGEEVGQTSYA